MSKTAYINWLKAAALLTMLVGLMAAAASHPATAEPWRLLFDVLSWPVDGGPATFSPAARALNAVLGGVMLGWGLMMFLLLRTAGVHSRKELAGIMLVALGAWFVVDSAGSLVAGLPGNVVLNSLFLLVFVPPLLGLRSSGA